MKKIDFFHKNAPNPERHILIAPTGFGKTLGYVIPTANNSEDTILLAALSEKERKFLSPFVTYLRISTDPMADKKQYSGLCENICKMIQNGKYKHIIVDEAANILSLEDLQSLMRAIQESDINVLFTFQSMSQVELLQIPEWDYEITEFTMEDLLDSNVCFTTEDFKQMYVEPNSEDVPPPPFSNSLKPLNSMQFEELFFGSRQDCEKDDEYEYEKQWDFGFTEMTINFDRFVRNVSILPHLTAGKVIDLLKECEVGE